VTKDLTQFSRWIAVAELVLYPTHAAEVTHEEVESAAVGLGELGDQLREDPTT